MLADFSFLIRTALMMYRTDGVDTGELCVCASLSEQRNPQCLAAAGVTFGSGSGVEVVCIGSTGYSTFGCSPVSVLRKATIEAVSAAFNVAPSCADPIIATACAKSQTFPEWKYGDVNSIFRSEGDLTARG